MLRGAALYLKALEIQGFKSFPDKTVLSFGEDITAIVGPNGSGKSNISDAIRWVMGEQSTKALRGGKMEDVIFGGTAVRRQQGFAEVSLVLDNTDHIFPLEESEVMVTRRYYRSGESEYYINRRSVRLKDVNELFMDTGLGREGYSIIGQGRIDEILSVKSGDRREIFEEAAGISRFRHRKEEAERKLERTQENLVRITDKIDELELQVEPLRQQSEKARKFLILRDELRGLEISLWLDQLEKIRSGSRKTLSDYENALRQKGEVQQQVEDLYAAAEAFSAQMRDKDVETEGVRFQMMQREADANSLENAIAVLKTNIQNNLENRDLDLINELNYKCDLLGMDTISLAGTIAFAMELQEKGMGDFGLKPGQPEDLPRVVEDVAYRRGPAGELSIGSKALSEKYGGADFAIHAKGLELAAYEPRKSVGMGLGYATANRGGCHLNGGYLALLESVGVISMDAQTPKGKPELTVFFQNGMEAASAAGFCLFTMQAMIPGILFKFGPASFACRAAGKVMLSARPLLGQIWEFMPWIMPINCMLVPHSKSISLVTGLPMTIGKFFTVGERSYNVERLYNLREGLTAADDALPGRLTKTPQDPDRPDTVVPLDKMLPVYYRVRGWDSHGVPTAKRLKHLGIPLPEGG